MRAEWIALGLACGCSALGPRPPERAATTPSAASARPTASELELATSRWVASPTPERERAFRRALENAPTREIVGLLAHPNAGVRDAAARCLVTERRASWPELASLSEVRGDLGPVAVAGLCEHARDAASLLLHLAERATDPTTRGEALGCVAAERPNESRRIALGWLEGKDPVLTRYAAIALGRSNAWYEVERLVRLTSDRDVEVRHAAVAALGRITSPPAAQALLAVARTSSEDALRELAWAAWLRHPEHRTGALSPSETKRTLGPLVKSVLRALGQRNMDALARLVHPGRGLRFGLCGKFIPSGLYPAQIRGLLRDDAPKSWGGSCRAEDHELSFDDYLDHLTGFEDAPIVGYDVWLAPAAKDLGQLPVAEVERSFPDGAFVELVWPEGRDGQTPWESLTLVFASSDGQYKLVGILQAQAVPLEPLVRGPVPPPDIKPDW
jgi:hypothetical protein